ncbi:hypothetical protein Agabi119p4_4246 [Agaricus bisporus var. burnettii]|uniref:Uncharacterized protein n=1 Tax=Agaricus bisporus var. burnettii TaxID=192524 RepID=A0A8H7F328_AGABI|nr:hypothetical protein Agabi119p4_4246 [Agaricus bisporus var. burnettii]
MNNSSMSNGRTTNSSGRNSATTRSFRNKLANVSRTSAALVASLSSAFSGKCNFAISSQIIDRQSSPELMKIKETVKGIPAIEFRTLSGFSKQIHDNNSRLQNYRREAFLNREFVSNEPPSKQVEEYGKMVRWVREEQNSFGIWGIEFIECHKKAIIERNAWITCEADKIDLKIRAIYTLRENTEYWQGFWEAIKDKLVPNISSAGPKAIQPLLALVSWAAELINSSTVYNKSWEREKFLEVLDTWEDMLTRDQKVILATKDEMSKYVGLMSKAKGLWSSEVDFVWLIHVDYFNEGNVNYYESCLQDLERAERMLSLTIKPFDEALNQIQPFYGSGISVQRTTKDFCDHVPYISIHLKQLLTAKGIIADCREEEYEENVYRLARIIYGRLENLKELCAQWSKSVDPGQLEKFLMEGTIVFLRETHEIIKAIKGILQTETQDSKRKQASKKRMEWDRRYKCWGWNDRPLVTSASAIGVLEDLDTIVKAIHGLSISTGTGTNMLSIGSAAEAKRSQVEFNRSNSLLSEFFRVLSAEIERGAIEFPEKKEKKEKEQPVAETKKSRGGVLRRQWARWRGTKPAAPNPMEELGLI